MAGGTWRHEDFVSYSRRAGRDVRADGTVDMSKFADARDLFKSRSLHPDLNPMNVMRECRDSEEHPATVPIILALDVTGSMGSSAMEVARMLGVIMGKLCGLVPDAAFCVMGIGDVEWGDSAPIQMSTYESDIRIAENLDKIWFEGGGGSNPHESYTAAWYMAARHTRLDCHRRGQKGLIITLGDEPCNPWLPAGKLAAVTGDSLSGDVWSKALYAEASKGFEIFHIHVNHCGHDPARIREIRNSFVQYIGDRHFNTAKLNEISDLVVSIVKGFAPKEGAGVLRRLFGGKGKAGGKDAPQGKVSTTHGGKMVEANVVQARCRKSRDLFGIRMERRKDGKWYCTWAFPMTEKRAAHEGYAESMISGEVLTEERYPGCPHCGGDDWIKCGACGRLTCCEGGETSFVCAWCGKTSRVVGASTFDLSGGQF